MRTVFFNSTAHLRAGWRLALWWAILIATKFGANWIADTLHLGEGRAVLDPLSLLVEDWLGTFVPVIVATVVMMKIERRTLADYYVPARGFVGKNFWTGAVWGIAAVSLLVGLIAVAGGYRITAVALHAHVIYWVLIWLAAAASVGIVEEIAFRGYMLRTLADGIGFWPAASILAFLFGALHYFGKPHERWEDWASVALLALFMSFTILRTGSLAWAMGWHFAFDWGAIWFWSGRNGGEYAPGKLFETTWPGSDHITGGLLGPEASWFVFVVIALLFAGFQFLYAQNTPNAIGVSASARR
jgi:uncharacterized protein